jgi:hypothetical protein
MLGTTTRKLKIPDKAPCFAPLALIIIERFCISAAQWLRIHVAQLLLLGPPSVPSLFPNILHTIEALHSHQHSQLKLRVGSSLCHHARRWQAKREGRWGSHCQL